MRRGALTAEGIVGELISTGLGLLNKRSTGACSRFSISDFGPAFAILLFGLMVCASPLHAQFEAPLYDFGRYRSKYPAMYATTYLTYQSRDAVFDANGNEVPTIAGTFGGQSEFPETRFTSRLEWHFPWFETANIPFISSRLHTARATLRAAWPTADGSITEFAAANGLQESAQGLGDLTVEFGTFILGSENWREQLHQPVSLLAGLGLTIPTGERDADAPVSPGANEFSYHFFLGGNWQPHRDWVVDAGAKWRSFARNEEPAFGAHEPSRRGDEWLFDASVNWRFLQGWYWGLFGAWLDGDANQYRRVRFAVDEPAPDAGNENFPNPATVLDGGTGSQVIGTSISWFLNQWILLGLHYSHPIAGESGEFDLPFLQQTAGCEATLSCDPQPNGTARVDGLGSARSYASDHWQLSISWVFGQGDFWF